MDELGSFFSDVQEEERKVKAELVETSTGSKRKLDEVDDMEVPVEDSQKSHKRVKSSTAVATPISASGDTTAASPSPRNSKPKVQAHHLSLITDIPIQAPANGISVPHNNGDAASTSGYQKWIPRIARIQPVEEPQEQVHDSSDAKTSKQSTTIPALKVPVRRAAGIKWKDSSLLDFPENDFRIFVGDLDRETQNEALAACFSKYPSFAMARVVKHKTGQYKGKGKGYGFVSFLDPMECARAIREEQGKLCLGRPMKITKSKWQDRDLKVQNKKEAKKAKMLANLGIT